MTFYTTNWLLLVISLPTTGATARMRIWRALKTLGCGALRDGVYLLPDRETFREQLGNLVEETVRESGSAWLIPVRADSAVQDAAYRALFDRTEAYADLCKSLGQLRKELGRLTSQEITRVLRKARRDYDAVRSIDYFPNDASLQGEAGWMDFVNVAETLLSPGEPQAADVAIQPLHRAEYQKRTWATRRRMWVDRIASAWLIQRFIDPGARFLWLDTPADCPSYALGFDFDGAAFTHVGERVTFEVLLASFGLEQDRGLNRLGVMVHALDVGGAVVPEASGFEAMLAGARQRASGDDQLLAEMSVVLDSLYAYFSNDPQSNQNQE